MLTEFLHSGTLNIIFAGVALLSFVFALVSLLGVGLGDAFDFDADVDGDTGLDVASISPFALAMFGAAFGTAGLVASLWLDLNPIPSILVAIVAGLLVGGLSQLLFITIFAPTKSSHYSLADDAVGRQAEVIITIPGSGQGQIAFDNVSGHVTLGARTLDGKQIKRGQLVEIERVSGRVAVVKPVE